MRSPPLFELGLAAWRLAYMLVQEEGPWRVWHRLRERTGIEHVGGEAVSWPDWNPLHCVFCTSVYTAALVVLAPRWVQRVLTIAGVAAVLETWRRGYAR